MNNKGIKRNPFRMCIVFLIKIFSHVVYDKRYLKGRYFEENDMGWKFVLKNVIWQKVFRINSKIPFPVSPKIEISNYKNLIFHPDDINNFQGFGVYYQNFDAKIIIGKGSYIAPNVGLITSNHDLNDLDRHVPGKDIELGKKCWIGMNSVVLPGVILGDKTIVAAGSVVTKSFKEGNCVIGGVPAKVIKYNYARTNN